MEVKAVFPFDKNHVDKCTILVNLTRDNVKLLKRELEIIEKSIEDDRILGLNRKLLQAIISEANNN